METAAKIFISLVCVVLVLGVVYYAFIYHDPYKGGIPVNAPPSKDNPRPIDVNTGKYLDQEAPTTQVDWPYVNHTGS